MYFIELNNGVEIPQIGMGMSALGSWQQDDEYVTDVILKAIAIGYRLFDTASICGNERALGRAIKESGLPREELFITSKVWDTEQGGTKTHDAFARSLERLQLEYLDLYLIQWPVPAYTRETWEAMEALYQQKKVRALGLSNFRKSDIEQIATFAEVRPVINQIELHPYFTQQPLVDYCQFHKIAIGCCSPLGSGSWSGVPLAEKPIVDPVIAEIADKYSATPAQVILKWNIQQHRIVVPKSESLENIRTNFLLSDFNLSNADIQVINSLNCNKRFGGDPDYVHKINMTLKVPD
ncbi:putative oxidoreductase MSMEG_2408/MSMEI_2347 [Microbulbifer sp. NBRC 101763]|uniref:aldo/keto reductase n=1 Tax=Microbulbifer TaxID=48073 RepID=UPI00036C5A97|nr:MULTISPECIES: aldo/keto reductase [Microbulbifer]WHI52321.1 aldo/keto reductase [Microbulbifer sp. MLAF003]